MRGGDVVVHDNDLHMLLVKGSLLNDNIVNGCMKLILEEFGHDLGVSVLSSHFFPQLE